VTMGARPSVRLIGEGLATWTFAEAIRVRVRVSRLVRGACRVKAQGDWCP